MQPYPWARHASWLACRLACIPAVPLKILRLHVLYQDRRSADRTHGRAPSGCRTKSSCFFVRGQRFTAGISCKGLLNLYIRSDAASIADMEAYAEEDLVSEGLRTWLRHAVRFCDFAMVTRRSSTAMQHAGATAPAIPWSIRCGFVRQLQNTCLWQIQKAHRVQGRMAAVSACVQP